MSQSTVPGNSTRGRGGRGRGGRSRGKAARARGSTRGMRIPPEYLAEVIARREGRDPASLTVDNENEDDENDEEWAKYAPRKLVQQDVEEQKQDSDILIVNEEDVAKAEEERQAELEVQRVIALHREKASAQDIDEDILRKASKGGKGKTVDDEGDVDHALDASLRAMTVKSGGKGTETIGSKVVQIEWNAELEALQRDKAEAEARTALKQRFKNPGFRGRGTGGSSLLRKPTAASVPEPAKPEIEVLEEFLDDLLQ